MAERGIPGRDDGERGGCAAYLLDDGGSPNARTIIGMTPLISAAGSNVEALRVLLEH